MHNHLNTAKLFPKALCFTYVFVFIRMREHLHFAAPMPAQFLCAFVGKFTSENSFVRHSMKERNAFSSLEQRRWWEAVLAATEWWTAFLRAPCTVHVPIQMCHTNDGAARTSEQMTLSFNILLLFQAGWSRALPSFYRRVKLMNFILYLRHLNHKIIKWIERLGLLCSTIATAAAMRSNPMHDTMSS